MEPHRPLLSSNPAAGVSRERASTGFPSRGRAVAPTDSIAWPRLSDTGSATAGGMAAALMLATSRLLASTGRPEFVRGALAGVERVFRAEQAPIHSGPSDLSATESGKAERRPPRALR